jgi:signal transduction histidine kinase
MGRTSRRDSVLRDVLRVAVPALLALVLLAAASFVLVRKEAEAEALGEATRLAEVIARTAIEPTLETVDVDVPTQRDQLDALVRGRLLVDPIVSARLWRADGSIAYASEPALIGQVFALGPEEREILDEGGTEADVSDLTKPENRYERGFGELIEVYTPVVGGDGTRYLFETYTLKSAIDASAERIMSAFVPLLLGSLVILAGILTALSWRMAVRMRQASAAREQLLRRSLDSSETERRRIAADLHDGVVQDLAGVTYALAALAERSTDPDSRSMLTRASDTTRRAVRSLRTLLVDIYPPSLSAAGLAAAISDLLASLPASISCTFSPPNDPVSLEDEQQAAVYRVARETLQNVAKHAQAAHVDVRLERVGRAGALLRVQDDGVGFDPAATPSGHFGLALLTELAESVGGRYSVDSAPGRGTTVEFEVGS